ncbi:MAG: hypothetical protein ASARMPREDX12_003710 [Alectoria sarmentosa]|nr:MAG: hypothetical protein ASARMPREDX12_003710 [Alectoria sarmentosa]
MENIADTIPSTLTAPFLYPSPSDAALKLAFVGKDVNSVQAPAAIVDSAVVKRNCRLMLEAAHELGIDFRAHVKAHKTTQITKLSVGQDSKSVKLVASTISEIENLLPWLLECKAEGKEISVLYGVPFSHSSIPRLAAVSQTLGPGTIGLFVDHPVHIKFLDQIDEQIWPSRIPVFVVIDVGHHREGVTAHSKQLADIAYALSSSNRTYLAGLYTHMGQAKGVNSPDEALKCMSTELEGLQEGAIEFLKCAGAQESNDPMVAKKIVLSLGATPTVTAVQNLFDSIEGAQRYRAMIDQINQSFAVELHAGVYMLLDMEQLATRARPSVSPTDPTKSLLSFSDIGLRILVEVVSLYPDRSERPEALIAAGSIVLGREPCKSYPGWGVVSPWPATQGPHYDTERSRAGWIVGRVSQEHGILTWEGSKDKIRELEVGRKLLIWPNHACIAGVNFGWYLVVDSNSQEPDKIVDVWTRWRECSNDNNMNQLPTAARLPLLDEENKRTERPHALSSRTVRPSPLPNT